MKLHGDRALHADERAWDLFAAYKRYMETHKYVSIPELFETIVNMPAKRFYVSSTRASIVISKIIKGDNLSYMCQSKRDMFFEIYRQYEELRQRNKKAPLRQLVGEIVVRPAPKFYLAPGSAKLIVNETKKVWMKKRQQKLKYLHSLSSSRG